MRDILDTYLRSMFYKNDSAFLTTVASNYCAFHKIETGVMIHLVGDGGDGKGLLDVLETGLVGEDNSASLEPNVFIEPGEFRKSGHFA